VKSILSIPLMTCALLMTMAISSSSSSATAQEPGATTSNPQQQQENTSPANVSGTWQGSWTSADGIQHPVTMQIKQKRSKLSGTFTGQRGSTSLKGSITENQVSFTIEAGQKISFSGTLDGNTMSGKTKQGYPWTLTRQQ
jgi:hypothetical protein